MPKDFYRTFARSLQWNYRARHPHMSYQWIKPRPGVFNVVQEIPLPTTLPRRGPPPKIVRKPYERMSGAWGVKR